MIAARAAKPIAALLLALSIHAWLPARQTESAEPKFESKTNLVLVPVIVRDHQSQIVKSLSKQDFQIFDNGKRQVISGFSTQTRGSIATAQSQQAEPSGHHAATSSALPQRFVIFLFDDLHLSPGELVQVKRAASRMVGESLQPDDAAAVISTSGLTNTGFTQNQQRLREGIASLHLQTLYGHVHGCPDITHYQADLIVNQNDPDALEAAIDDVRHCSLGAEVQVGRALPHMGPVPADTDSATMLAWSAARSELAMGEQGTRVAEGIIQQLIAKLGTLPGQHSLILVSPGFFVGTSGARLDEERILDKAAQANVMISSLDARGLYTFMLDSSQRYISLDKEKYNQESLKANDAVMAELAAGTGGTYFHNSNDLAGGFKALTAAPECLYLLEFSPSNAKPDGTYHRLSVKLNLAGAKLQLRHGYFTDKVPKTKR